MGVERLKRVAWRVKEWNLENDFRERDLRRAIMLECGSDPLTIINNKKAMLELGIIKRIQYGHYKILNLDIQ